MGSYCADWAIVLRYAYVIAWNSLDWIGDIVTVIITVTIANNIMNLINTLIMVSSLWE